MRLGKGMKGLNMISIIANMSDNFSIDAMEAPATEEEISELRKFSPITVPDEYIELMRQAAELEIKVKQKRYIRVWSPRGCMEMNAAYRIQNYIPGSLAIGDDEGGNALLYCNSDEGFGLYSVSFSDLDICETTFIAHALYDLFVNNVGVGKLLSL
jgi:hypothetical protein